MLSHLKKYNECGDICFGEMLWKWKPLNELMVPLSKIWCPTYLVITWQMHIVAKTTSELVPFLLDPIFKPPSLKIPTIGSLKRQEIIRLGKALSWKEIESRRGEQWVDHLAEPWLPVPMNASVFFFKFRHMFNYYFKLQLYITIFGRFIWTLAHMIYQHSTHMHIWQGLG